MFFLIRCVFWLTVVFSTIFNPDQGPMVRSHRIEAMRQEEAREASPVAGDSAERLGQLAQNWVTATLERFWSKAKGGCAGTPAECVALAARLSDFAQHHSFDDRSVRDARQPAPISFPSALTSLPPSEARAQVPLPPLRPQRVRLPEKPANRELAREKHFSSGHAETRFGRS